MGTPAMPKPLTPVVVHFSRLIEIDRERGHRLAGRAGGADWDEKPFCFFVFLCGLARWTASEKAFRLLLASYHDR
jgi:hypothetical protein